jgi:hypothetical protein
MDLWSIGTNRTGTNRTGTHKTGTRRHSISHPLNNYSVAGTDTQLIYTYTQPICTHSLYIHTTAGRVPRSPWNLKSQIRWHFSSSYSPISFFNHLCSLYGYLHTLTTRNPWRSGWELRTSMSTRSLWQFFLSDQNLHNKPCYRRILTFFKRGCQVITSVIILIHLF